MAKFLQDLLKANAKDAQEPKVDTLAEIPIDGLNLNVTVKAYDSSLEINSRWHFIRRYVILLTGLSDQGIRGAARLFKLDERNMQADGSLLLEAPIPGEAMIMADWLDHMNKRLSANGLHLPMDAIQKAIDGDLARQGPGYLEPIPEKKPEPNEKPAICRYLGL